MKMFKKKDGFTLVELIVVIAILAILAGVAIPAYSGYLEKANESADITTLSAIKTAATARFAVDGEVTKIVVTDGETDAVVVHVDNAESGTPVTADKEFLTYLGQTGTSVSVDLKSKEYDAGAQWTSAGWAKVS